MTGATAAPPRRWPRGLALAVVVALGLLSRRHPLPGIFAEHAGDALYTAAAYCAFAVLRPTASPRALAVAAWAVSALVELSQLLRWSWLVELRAARPWSLLLGQGFRWADLLAYAVGALLAGCIDSWWLRRAPPRSRR